MTRCGYVEHGLEYFSFYVQKHIAHMAACSGPPAGLRLVARGTHISETRSLMQDQQNLKAMSECLQIFQLMIWRLKTIVGSANN